MRPIKVKTDLQHSGAGQNSITRVAMKAFANYCHEATIWRMLTFARGTVVSGDHEPAPITIRQQCTRSSLVTSDSGMMCPSQDPADATKPRHASEQKRAGHLYGGCKVGSYGKDSNHSEADASAASFLDADEKMASVTL